ncbi:ephexin-1 isoform X2 [Octopus sinensis]|nr:ephexin-1 isoform X2 [Octopus sinensis]XP_029651570.1 ephexin-1 isoform X2 [Octopus sinensis]XP_036369707.1 ephexin-1 isoform X2 [Octopus sinensis]XP_036369708.1 ephexin-1 isoform X2 [Octopus sinensis]XP_036369709.1 ephexin-1 isoform X2 [Octopus sinensis]
MNGQNSANSKTSSALVKHTNRVDDDDDDDDDFYESIDAPLKSATKSDSFPQCTKAKHLSWMSLQDSGNYSNSSQLFSEDSVLRRKNAIKRQSTHSLREINQVNYIDFPPDSAMKKRDVSETPPPIPPRDKIPEAPPLPPRKQEESLSLKTVVPLPIPSPKNNRNSSSQDSSSNDSLPGSKTKPGGETENRKLSHQLSEDYVCMSSPDFLTNSSEHNFPDLNKLDYDEDNLYGVNNERYKSCFGLEPLYQFCGTDIKKQKKGVNRNSHIYCEIGSLDSGKSESKVSNTSTSESQGSESLGSEFLRANSQRTLWHEMPQVKNSGLLKTISDSERKCQEAIFEVITSEASYLKSLNILMTTFLLSPEFSDKSGKSILSRQERHEMFSNIGAVRETSEKFLADLEERWKKSSQIHDICDIITEHVQKDTFNVYIRYCTNMTYQERMYNKLLKRPEFETALKSIERKDACQRLPMKTFLLLPMQRITRIPLLIDSIRHRLDPNTDRYRSAEIALLAINKIVKQCNEGARQMECMEELIALQKQMQFKVKEFPLISASRMLVKKGEAIEIVSEPSSKTIFKRSKPTKNPIYLFLFNDLLLLTKKRGNHYDVVDYCSRAFLDPQRIRDPDKCKLLPHGVPPNVRFLILLVMLENFENKRVEMILAFNSENDCERWLTAVTPVTVEGNERIYSAWDCPEVEAICSYKAYEKDELSLEPNDVVTVFRKLNDGWYYGERSHDGETGWFPSEVTKEIVGEHSRARNMRLKYQVEGNIEVE